MCTESGDLVGDLLFEACDNGYGHDHNSQTQGNTKHGNAHNGTRETAPLLPAANHPAYDKKFGIQGFSIGFIKCMHLLAIFKRCIDC
jgi:hypothetical protein